jgi:hypothetical protein
MMIQRSPVSEGAANTLPAALDPATATAPAAPDLDIQTIAERVYATLVQRLADERERRGW